MTAHIKLSSRILITFIFFDNQHMLMSTKKTTYIETITQ